jgi:hypothetical protein
VSCSVRRRGRVFEHQSAFVEALRGGHQMRNCMFNAIEQNHAQDFRDPSVGPRLYKNILSAVRDSGAAEAIQEFESRFLPLVNSKQPDKNQVRAEADRGRGRWVGISVVLAVASLAALIAGFKTLKITAAEANRLNVKMTSTPVRAHAVAGDGVIVPTKTTEPASEMVTEPAPAFSAEQERSDGD